MGCSDGTQTDKSVWNPDDFTVALPSTYPTAYEVYDDLAKPTTGEPLTPESAKSALDEMEKQIHLQWQLVTPGIEVAIPKLEGFAAPNAKPWPEKHRVTETCLKQIVIALKDDDDCVLLLTDRAAKLVEDMLIDDEEEENHE